MKYSCLIVVLTMAHLFCSCTRKTFSTNGETIFRTGKNLSGQQLLDRKASKIRLFRSCSSCHGKKGDAMGSVSIQFSYLSDPRNFRVPYTDSLFYRFLDHDLKSDGQKANIGVIWRMNSTDKEDLLTFLKGL